MLKMGMPIRCGNCGQMVEDVCSGCWRCKKCCKCIEKHKRIDGSIKKAK